MAAYTRLLYNRPSFLEGVARAFDIGGTLNSRIDLGDLTDRVALASDWYAIGGDIEYSITLYRKRYVRTSAHKTDHSKSQDV